MPPHRRDMGPELPFRFLWTETHLWKHTFPQLLLQAVKKYVYKQCSLFYHFLHHFKTFIRLGQTYHIHVPSECSVPKHPSDKHFTILPCNVCCTCSAGLKNNRMRKPGIFVLRKWCSIENKREPLNWERNVSHKFEYPHLKRQRFTQFLIYPWVCSRTQFLKLDHTQYMLLILSIK